MRTITAIALAAVLNVGCASQNKMMTEYKKITKDVSRDNPQEVILAQHLYNEMRKTYN